MPAIHVLLVDDHPVTRAGIRTLIEGDTDIVVVGEACNGVEAIQLCKKLTPEVVVLDVEMPGISGIEVVQHIQKENLPVRILILSAHDEAAYVQELFLMGVAGYLVKEEALDHIIDAIHGVARGEQGWVSRRVAAQMYSYVQEDKRNPHGLTSRETEVLKAVVAGKTNREIAGALGISEKTIEKHLETIFDKLHVSSRVQAAVRAIQDGLL